MPGQENVRRSERLCGAGRVTISLAFWPRNGNHLHSEGIAQLYGCLFCSTRLLSLPCRRAQVILDCSSTTYSLYFFHVCELCECGWPVSRYGGVLQIAERGRKLRKAVPRHRSREVAASWWKESSSDISRSIWKVFGLTFSLGAGEARVLELMPTGGRSEECCSASRCAVRRGRSGLVLEGGVACFCRITILQWDVAAEIRLRSRQHAGQLRYFAKPHDDCSDRVT